MGDVRQMPRPKPDAVCPRCGGHAIRIRRSFWDRFRRRITFGKFECYVCDYRFFAPRAASPA